MQFLKNAGLKRLPFVKFKEKNERCVRSFLFFVVPLSALLFVLAEFFFLAYNSYFVVRNDNVWVNKHTDELQSVFC
jgi:hypothetical protein